MMGPSPPPPHGSSSNASQHGAEGVTAPRGSTAAPPSRAVPLLAALVAVVGLIALTSAVLAYRFVQDRTATETKTKTKTKTKTSADASPPGRPPGWRAPVAASPCERDLQATADTLTRLLGKDARFHSVHLMPTMAIVVVNRPAEPGVLAFYNYDFDAQDVTRVTGSELTPGVAFYDLGAVSWIAVGRFCSEADAKYRALAGGPGEAKSLMVTARERDQPPDVVINVESPKLQKAFCWKLNGQSRDC